MFDPAAIEAARAHAKRAYPNESCGFIVGGVYQAQVNRSATPADDFSVDPDAYIAALREGGIQAVIHSHPDGPDHPSAADMRGQIDSGVPWGIITVNRGFPGAPFWWGDGVPVEAYVGREFRHGVSDCYSLIRDWYRLERNAVLPEFPRDWEWWEKGGDLYTDGFEKAGFRQISAAEAETGDVFLASIRSSVPNHGGILLENGIGLHHLQNRLSRHDPIARWMTHITHWLRFTR